MPNVLASSGAQPQKPTRFTDLYTGRFFSGLFTNRSPLRDGTTDHLTERFYGQVGDTMIAGNNVEISNRLTLIRRPGNDVFDSNSYTAVNRFEEFRLFNSSLTHIKTMIDEANTLSALDGSTKTVIFNKAANAGQSHMQPVENSLYWGDGVSNKKWIETLNTWAILKTASTSGVGGASLLGTPNYPFMSTFIIDSNSNIQQLLAYAIQSVSNVAVASNVVTFTVPAVTGIAVGQVIVPWLNTANVLNGVPLKVITATGTTVTASPTAFAANYTLANYGSAADTGALAFFQGVPSGSNLLLSAAQPTFSTTVPSSSNKFAGGITVDANAIWVNRGSYVQNWGISPPSVPTGVMKFGTDITNGASTTAWRPNTYYSPDGVIIDANGGIQLLTTAGKSGSTTPTWQAAGAGVGTTTTDGTNVWTKIQTAASTTWASGHQYTGAGTPNFTPNTNSSANYIVANGCLFKLLQGPGPWFTNGVSVQCEFWHNNPNVSFIGHWQGVHGSLPAPDSGPTTITSLLFGPTGTVSDSTGIALPVNTINGAGETTGTTTPDAGAVTNFGMSVFGSLHVPATALTLTIAVSHDDGMQFGFGAGTNLGGTPVLIKSVSNIGVSSLNGAVTPTGVKGYTVIGANNQAGNAFEYYVIQFPAEDDYPFEFNLAQSIGEKQLAVNIGATGNIVPTPLVSNSVTPVFPAWSTLGLNAKSPVYGRKNIYDANLNATTNGFSTYSSQAYQWVNLGPTSDFAWIASTNYNPAGSITDANGNTEFPVRAGKSSGTQPTWKTGVGQYTVDSNIQWLNQGLASATPSGTVSTFNGGWQYTPALANSLDETVSNAAPLSTATGNFVNSTGIILAAAAGLPATSSIDSQCDQVCIFRTTDGQATPLLIDGVENSFFTVPLCTYLNYGFTDSTPDTGLDANLQGPISGENTAPAAGARCLTFHLNRIFFSVGNTVYWTGGPDAPIGNGTDGVPTTNFDVVPSLVVRLVPTATGVWVFTVSDIYFIPGTGQVGDPIRQAQKIEEGVGLLSYNALAVNGSVIGFMSSDKQFLLMQPGAGIIYAGHPIGDQFRSPNSVTGTPTGLVSWNPANVYVTWHVNGEDQAWYVADGTYGWYRLMSTPAPERSMPCWSPFATIVGGVKAVQSIETAPGVHNLLLGPTGTGSILKRNLAVNTDNSSTYSAFGVVGSIVLAHPGQIAEVMFITTDSIVAGTPLTLGILIGEAIPVFTGPFEALTNWESDPPNQPQSTSILGQRFYLDALQQQSAMMRHLQIRFNWIAENAANELDAFTIWGTYNVES